MKEIELLSAKPAQFEPGLIWMHISIQHAAIYGHFKAEEIELLARGLLAAVEQCKQAAR